VASLVRTFHRTATGAGPGGGLRQHTVEGEEELLWRAFGERVLASISGIDDLAPRRPELSMKFAALLEQLGISVFLAAVLLLSGDHRRLCFFWSDNHRELASLYVASRRGVRGRSLVPRGDTYHRDGSLHAFPNHGGQSHENSAHRQFCFKAKMLFVYPTGGIPRGPHGALV